MNKAFVIQMELLLLLKWFDSSLCISRILAMNWILPAPLFDIHFGFCGINSSYWLLRLRAKALHQIFNLWAYENDFFSQKIYRFESLLHCIWIHLLWYYFRSVDICSEWNDFTIFIWIQNRKSFLSQMAASNGKLLNHNLFVIGMNLKPCHAMKSVHNKNY